jgi:signal transduction histidine kinase
MTRSAAAILGLVLAVIGLLYLQVLDHRGDTLAATETLALSEADSLLARHVGACVSRHADCATLSTASGGRPPRIAFDSAGDYQAVLDRARLRRAHQAALEAGGPMSTVTVAGDSFLVIDSERVSWMNPVVSRIRDQTQVWLGPLHNLDGNVVAIDPEVRRLSGARFLTGQLPFFAFLMGVAWLVADEVERLSRRARSGLARERDREELLQRLSHQLRTPAAAVSSLVSALRGDNAMTDEERQQFLGLLDVEAGRVSSGIHQLMVAARGSLDRTPELRPVVLQDWGRTVIERWFVAIEGLSLSVQQDAGSVMADPDMLDEAVDALLDNAIKYGGANVVLSASVSAGEVVIVVSDDGPGVPRKSRKRLLQRLERVEGRRGDPGGFGLGLWAAAEVARLHGGTLTIEDEARFTIRFPEATA